EADGVVLGHVRAHDQDRVRVREVLLERGGSASAERGPQTGDRGAVSYARLVLDLDDAETHGELLDQVVLLVVEGRSTEHGDAHRPLGRGARVDLLLSGRIPSLDLPICDTMKSL